jgi:hypothetical protein
VITVAFPIIPYIVYLSHILSYYIYIAKIHELNCINFLISSTPTSTCQATSRRKKQKICSGRIPPLNLCQATSRRKKKQKSKRFAFAKFHLFVPSNYFIEKKAKRLSVAEFYPFVPSNFREKKRKSKSFAFAKFHSLVPSNFKEKILNF